MQEKNMDILNLFEEDYAQPQAQWTLEQWKSAALGVATMCKEYEEVNQLLNEHVKLLEADNKKKDENITKITGWIDELIVRKKPKKRGRPRHNLLRFLVYRQPLKKRGGQKKLTDSEELAFIEKYEKFKKDNGLTTDKAAVREFHKNLPVRGKSIVIEKNYKLFILLKKKIHRIEI